jgi:hypothetical protein
VYERDQKAAGRAKRPPRQDRARLEEIHRGGGAAADDGVGAGSGGARGGKKARAAAAASEARARRADIHKEVTALS